MQDGTIRVLARPVELLPARASCRQVDRLFLAEPDRASAVVATAGQPLLVNRRHFYEALTGPLGYGRTLFYGRPVDEVLPDTNHTFDAGESAEQAALSLLQQLTPVGDDVLVRCPDGWATAPVASLYRHLAESHAARAPAIASSEERLRRLVEHAVDVITIVDPVGRVLYRSRPLEGFDEAPVGGDFFQDVHPDDVADLQIALQRGSRHPSHPFSGEFRMLDRRRHPHLFEYTARAGVDDPALGGIVINQRDISERRALEERLVHDAFHDPLTGLPNRALLFQRAEYALGRLERVPGRVAALYVDLDGFKAVNDDLGHEFGDAVIITVAERLRARLRRGDTVARLGGDEFVVLSDGCGPDEADELGRRLLDALTEPVSVDGRPMRVSASIGLAVTTVPIDVATLLQRADSAMYAAKAAGRNRLERFDPAKHQERLRRIRLGVDLPNALAGGGLHLHYQLIVGASGALRGAEALVRWDHRELGPVPPLEFVGVAEHQGLADRLGAWVLDQACRQLAAWGASGVDPGYLSVNVSAHQLDDPAFPRIVLATLRRQGIEPERLQLEVTESGLATENPQRVAALQALRHEGVAVAIDDFGTGYSSLSYLRSLPVDVVKLDRTFIADLDHSEDAATLVRSMVELAHSLGYRVTAEGVESDAQRLAAVALGCDDLQGFLFARPGPAGEVTERLRATLAVGPS